MAPTLRERLLGRTISTPLHSPAVASNGTGLGGAALIDGAGPSSGMYSNVRSDEVLLTPVDQLKVDLHRRLIERLDLEALEKISDESVVVLQIRNAVSELL